MADNISVSIFGTFGNPNGFTQSIAGSITGVKKYDLNPTAIQLFESTKELYAIRKELMGSAPVISLIKYSYASEQGSSRGGTFVGASIIFANGIADFNSSLSVLDNLHKNLISNKANLQDGVIIVKHANEFKIKNVDTTKLFTNVDSISDIDFLQKGKNLVVYTLLKKIQTIIANSLDLLSAYDTIYFTDDVNVANYVQKKGLYELVTESEKIKELSEKINSNEDLKIKKQRAVLEKLYKDIESVNLDKGVFVKNFQEILEKNKEIHEKNAQKIIDDENKVKVYSSSFDNQVMHLKQLSEKLDGKQLKQSERLRIEKEIGETYAAFERERRTFSEPTRLDSFPEPRRIIAETSRHTFSDTWKDDNDAKYKRKENLKGFTSKEVLVIFSVVAILGLAGFATWYFLFSNKSAYQSANSLDYTSAPNEMSSWNDSTAIITLIPEPSGVLSFDDTKKTVEKQFPNEKLPIPIDSVVYRIFKANPSDIGKPYFGKEKEYADLLIQQNPNHFDVDKKMIRTDNLQIPTYNEKKKLTSSSSSLPNTTEIDEGHTSDRIQHPSINEKTTDKPSTLNNLK
ncbi:hypothetical protein [Kaistella palustris]|uniref:hypothetical protein n=1 Tax=Kaistella palustris TaxID=493376 RepID=UPI00040D9B5B|nr:hypothetical protein [Kaistella palustris]